MRTCAEYQELISALLDGELTAEETAEVEAHIAGCGECKAMYEAFAAVSGMEAAEVPDTLHEAVMTKVTAAQKAFKTQNNLVRLRPILTTAACLVVIVGTIFAVRTGFRRDDKAASEAPMAAPAAGAADMEAPELFMKAASESPAEAAPMEAPAEPMAAAPAAMAPTAEEAEEGYSYANDIARDEPLPAPEPKAKAENSAMLYLTLKIVSMTDYGFTATDLDTDKSVEVYCDDSTEIAEEVHDLMPDMIVTVGYSESEDSVPMQIYADAIWFEE